MDIVDRIGYAGLGMLVGAIAGMLVGAVAGMAGLVGIEGAQGVMFAAAATGAVIAFRRAR